MRERWKRPGVALSITLMLPLLAGCLASTSNEPGGAAAGALASAVADRPTVIAILDTGINPYHQVFQANATTAKLGDAPDALRGVADSVTLARNGSWPDRRKADDAFWSGLPEGSVVAFNGTRVMGVSFLGKGPRLIDRDGHGTSVAGYAAAADPHAILLMVQVDTSVSTAANASLSTTNDSLLRALEWTANQPWIDVISLSLDNPANVPTPSAAFGDAARIEKATERAAASGKLVLVASGNDVTPPFASSFAGPPWVIAVGGAQPAAKGDASPAGKAPDVVSNYSAWAPQAYSLDSYAWTLGTSFATPRAAATLSAALYEVRAHLRQNYGIRDGALVDVPTSNGRPFRAGVGDFRGAMNASAILYLPTDYDPTKEPTNDPVLNLEPVLPVLVPAAQQGWGFVDPRVAHDIAKRVEAHDATLPSSKVPTAALMERLWLARTEYWSQATTHLGS